MNKNIDFKSLIETWIEFNQVGTWTKNKHDLRNLMVSYVSNKKTVSLSIHCQSNNCITHESNDFLIIKINPNRRGLLRPYRNKWVLIFSTRERFYMSYLVHVLPSDFNPEKVIQIGRTFGVDISTKIKPFDEYQIE